MLFKWELIEKIVRGEKIQTRRPVKEGEEFWRNHLGEPSCITHNGRTKIAVGKDYAVQYGRGKPTAYYQKYRGESRMVREVLPYEKYKRAFDKHGVTAGWHLQQSGYYPLRILITDIRREDVRNISLDDAIAEGFESRLDFWKVWCGFYDPSAWETTASIASQKLMSRPYQSPYMVLKKRPDELYQAWAYTFEVL